MLTKMLDEANALDKMSLPDKTILMKLASIYQDDTSLLFKDPEELEEYTQSGTKEQWKQLLQIEQTQNFIKGQLAFFAQVSQRKTFHSLVEMALKGNQQAAKQVQELSGIMNQQDTNRTIILHQIPRPEKPQPQEVQES